MVDVVGDEEQPGRSGEAPRAIARVAEQAEYGVDGDELRTGRVVQGIGAILRERGVERSVVARIPVGVGVVDRVVLVIEEHVVQAPGVHADGGDRHALEPELAHSVEDLAGHGFEVPPKSVVAGRRGAEAVGDSEGDAFSVEVDRRDPTGLRSEVDSCHACHQRLLL